MLRRSFIVLTVVALGIAGCSQDDDAESDPATIATEIVDKWNAAWVASDAEAAAALFTDDGVYVMQGEHQGPGISAYFQSTSEGLTFAERLGAATQTDTGTFVVPTRVEYNGVMILTDLQIELDGDLASRIDHLTWVEEDQ